MGEDGLVTEKSFFRYYRVRPSAQSVLKDLFDVDFDTGGDPFVEAAGEGARVSAVLAAEGLVFMQRDPLYVRLALDPGLHIYRGPVPEGFIATEVTVTGPEGLEVDAPVFPDAHPFRVAGIPHEFQVMEGNVEIEVPISWTKPDNTPDAAKVVPVDITVRYQACDEQQCFIPRTVELHMDLPVGTLYRARPAAPPPDAPAR
ncbi:MAG: protein-disulfide reductase DsbD domain-containing protein [Dehalococcoidia bacterium]